MSIWTSGQLSALTKSAGWMRWSERVAARLLRRLLRHRGFGARHRGAAHVARLRLIVAAHAMHGLPVIPHHEIMHRPSVDMDEFRPRGMLGEVAQQQARLRHAHANN